MALKVPFHRAKEAQLILTLKIIDSYTKEGGATVFTQSIVSTTHRDSLRCGEV
jgi:hypothetical protein